MNEFPDMDSVFTLPSSNQYFVVQNLSKQIDVDSSVPVLFLDENQTGLVNNFFCSNNFEEDVDAFFASDDLGNELLRFDKDRSFSNLINIDDDMGDIIRGQKEDSNNSDVDIEGVSEDESTKPVESERTIYLCSQCSLPFGSIDECKEHMIKDHKLELLLDSVPESDSAMSDSTLPLISQLEDPNDRVESSSTEVEPSLAATSAVHSNEPVLPIENTSTVQEPVDQVQNEGPVHGSEAPAQISEAEINESEPLDEPEVDSEPKSPGLAESLFKDPDFVAKPFKCDFLGCCIRFVTHKGCVMHQDCHEVSSKAYVCSQENCCKKFVNWKQCSLHLWKAHAIDIDLFTCPVCLEYKTWSKYCLKTHVKIHFAEKRYTCSECGKKFKQKPQLWNHINGVHAKKIHKEKPKPADSNDKSSEKWYTEKVCKICSKTYADSKCLKQHVQAVHRKMKPYICNICGHQSAKKSMMQVHIRSHTGEKPYSCTFEGCSYRTGDHNSLRRHLWTHSGKRPYQCSYCSFSCIQSINFKKHLTTKHSEKGGAHVCSLCPFSTVNPTLFENHRNDHKKGLLAADDTQTTLVEQPPCITLTTDDEDTINCFPTDEGIITGGITIPAHPNQEPLIFIPSHRNPEFEIQCFD